jgi:hypothetical protein
MEQIFVESIKKHKKISFNLDIMFYGFPRGKNTFRQIQKKMVWSI